MTQTQSTVPRVRISSLTLCLGIVSIALVAGCDPKKPATSNSVAGGAPTREAEATILASLDNQQDAGECRTVLQQLDNLDSALTRPTLSETERNDLTAFLRLTPAESAEISQATFSQTDAAYLEECLLVRAGVRSLKIDNRPPLERARLGFDWACRMVYVDDRVPWPTNPWTTLQSGSGVALSRAYVVLAVWQQLGLDGCLIGPPGVKTTASFTEPKAPGEELKYAPVRACGVKVGKDVFLFDHAAGQAIAAADGKGVLTLAQAKAGPDSVKGIAAGDEVKTWQPFLAPSLSALSRRMDWLEKLNPGGVGVQLLVDVKTLRDQFAADVPDEAVDGWNPDRDVFSATRVLTRYAAEEATTRGKVALRDSVRVRMVPLEHMPKINLGGEALGHINMAFGIGFESLRYKPGTSRDSLLRGLFSEAIRPLEDLKKDLDNARTRMEQDKNLQKDFEEWAEHFQSLSARAIRAREREPEKYAAASQELDQFRASSRNRDIERSFVLGQASRPLGAEVTFLMANAVHERAERSQLEGSARAAENWRNACDWWERFLDASAQAKSPFPPRESHARALLARCRQFATR